MRRVLALAAAFLHGVRDGWQQPHYLSTSRNMEHLEVFGKTSEVYNTQDGGINIGQLLHAGTKSQAWAEGYWPFTKEGGRTNGR